MITHEQIESVAGIVLERMKELGVGNGTGGINRFVEELGINAQDFDSFVMGAADTALGIILSVPDDAGVDETHFKVMAAIKGAVCQAFLVGYSLPRAD